ncbi:hypothetical protein [Photorhabdus bodei]|uniref:Uncharacterized protein n=1 Tax=Photorhabdus bodei TaxID=2029681 RepID=A0ABX0AX50_9GAMM|nr:hypothetical protein [Photorhabdus bodei]NDL05159.1 hypothetical protein [Photorhabdus bodei]NDL08480.1 hypothetical protein [Photorhabdus bodei]
MQKQSISLNLVGPINGVITDHEINHLTNITHGSGAGFTYRFFGHGN